MSDFQQISTEIDSNGLMVITLDRPDVMNAFTARMMHEICSALDEADNNDARGDFHRSGDRAYCAGADLSQGDKTFNYEKRQDEAGKTSVVGDDGKIDWSNEQVRDSGGVLTLRIYECVKPVIGAINGAAVGVGATMLLPMDIRIASENARFGFVFARRGIVPEACSSWFLPRIVGISQGFEMVLFGQYFRRGGGAGQRAGQ